MKSNALMALCGAFFLFATFGCSKGSSSGGGASFTMDVWGKPYVGIGIVAANSVSQQIFTVTAIQVKAGDTVGVNLEFADTASVGEQQLIGYTGSFLYQNLDSTELWSEPLMGTGEVTITALDTTTHTISCTFNAVLYGDNNDSLDLTNGRFTTTYTNEP